MESVIEETIEETARIMSTQYDEIIWINDNNQIVINQDIEFCKVGFFGGEIVLQ